MTDKPQTTTQDFRRKAENLGDATIQFLVEEDDLPIHKDDREAVILDIQQALIDAFSQGCEYAR